jgi:hypothetical protein
MEAVFADRMAQGVLRSAMWGQAKDGTQQRVITWNSFNADFHAVKWPNIGGGLEPWSQQRERRGPDAFVRSFSPLSPSSRFLRVAACSCCALFPLALQGYCYWVAWSRPSCQPARRLDLG